MPSPGNGPSPPRRSRWPQFTLGTLLRAMLIVSILTAVLGGLLRGKEELEESGTGAATFVVIALVAPLAVLIVISTVNGLVAAWKALRRRR